MENDNLAAQLNEEKRKNADLSSKCLSFCFQIDVLTKTATDYPSCLKRAEADKKGLQKLAHDFMKKYQELLTKKTPGTANKLVTSVPRGYVSITLAVKKRCKTWALAETQEVAPSKTRWRGIGLAAAAPALP